MPGHWEGDLLIGTDCKSAVGTLVERATRYVMLLHLPAGRDARRVEQAMRQAITALPGELARTITWAAAQALTGSVSRTQVRAAAALSDGASRLIDRFGLATWEEALKTLDTLGPHELLRQVREAEKSDPYGARWPRGKAHDDATAVYCSGISSSTP